MPDEGSPRRGKPRPLSEERHGLVVTTPPRVKEKLSSLAKGINVTEIGALRRETLRPLIWFFIGANSVMILGIIGIFAVEHFFPRSTSPERVVDSKVLIAAVGGLAVQSGSVIIAAFKGLFGRGA